MMKNLAIGIFLGVCFLAGFISNPVIAQSEVRAIHQESTLKVEKDYIGTVNESWAISIGNVPPPVIEIGTVKKIQINDKDENIVVCWDKKCKRLIEIFPKEPVLQQVPSPYGNMIHLPSIKKEQ